MSGFSIFLIVFFTVLSVLLAKSMRDEKRANRFRRQQAVVELIRQERE